MQNLNSNTIILVTRNGMGHAEPELAQKLFATYLRLLAEGDDLPAVMCFYAEGVRLAVSGSPVLEQLKGLEAKGVRLVLCSTCLSFYNLMEEVQVGITGGMPDIVTAMQRAQKVISL